MLHVKKGVTVNRPREDVYQFWRDLENLPRFMQHLEMVEAADGGRSHWVAKAPGGKTVEWDAEIIEERPNELIAWRSLAGSDVRNEGAVRFTQAPGDRGTEVHVELLYDAPAGRAGATIAKLFGEEPSRQIRDDLRRFKQVMETGEIVRSEGNLEGAGQGVLKQRAAQAPEAEARP
ncbi:MAG: SRPBCC family protein [Acidobacteria bacterium]|nr:SRPBCC family protein [Acidobacteriota bacterium]MCA1651919.1 SRPBCC family protein [Acidobacteriota bacterium]